MPQQAMHVAWAQECDDACRSCRSWVFELNPEVTWQEVGLETKLRLKTLLTEAVSGNRNQCVFWQSAACITDQVVC